jgi:iron complex transport system substrate-binding protein
MWLRHLRFITLALCASLAMLAGCGTASTSGTTTTANGPTKLAPLCDNLTGLAGTLTPKGTYGPGPTTDYDGAPITIPATPPQRIIALTPTDTEIITALIPTDRLVGIDYFSQSDPQFSSDITSKPVITTISGFTSSVNVEKVLSLHPDLVLSHATSTFAKADATLRQAGINVISLPAANLAGTLGDILFIGQILSAQPQANTLVARMETCINTVKTGVAGKTPISTYMEIDDSVAGKPYTVGQGSFENDIIQDAGGANIFATDTSNGGYPEVSDEAVIAANPQTIILAESVAPPFVKPQNRPAWQTVAAVQNSRVFIVDDNLLSHEGPSLMNGLAAVAEDLWPTLFS